MTGIGLISNPYSKRNRKYPERLKKLEDLLPDQTLAQHPTDLSGMDSAMAIFRDREIDVLAVNGGDGTVHIALSSLVKIYGDRPLPKLAILKGGTMNQTATASNIRGDSFDILTRVSTAFKENRDMRCERKPLLKVGERYGFIFGNGVTCNFMDIYHEGGNPSPFVALKCVVRTLASMLVRGDLYRKLFKPVKCEIVVDGFSYGFSSYLTILLSTISEVGLGFKLMHRAKGSIEKAHMIALKEGASIASLVGRAWRGKSLPPTAADDSVGNHFIILSEAPFRYTIDGDIYHSDGTLTVETGPVIDLITE